MLSADPRKAWNTAVILEFNNYNVCFADLAAPAHTVSSCQYLAFLRNRDSQNQDIPAYPDHKKLEYGD